MKKDYLRNVLMSPVFFVHTMKVNCQQNCLVANINQNILFCFPTGLELYDILSFFSPTLYQVSLTTMYLHQKVSTMH